MWKKLSKEAIRKRIFDSLNSNIDFYEGKILGVPASHLDGQVFYKDASFLKDKPFLYTLVNNPNHIGCHTLGDSEAFFEGTQELEREVISICSEDIFKGKKHGYDGYVASGGTEANIQAIWIYRNYFKKEFKAKLSEITILCTRDNHYSMDKASNLLNIGIQHIHTNHNDRSLDQDDLDKHISRLMAEGKKYFIVVANMMTTMFGSVDDVDQYASILKKHQAIYKIHIDGAYGGFFYPFSNQKTNMNFSHPEITSVTLDAHKMVQAPYGTGIFMIEKGMMQYTFTEEAQYVKGLDATLIGSRSGANAVAVWMILMTYGPHGWYEKIQLLLIRTNWLCDQLSTLGIAFYRNPYSNIVTIHGNQLSAGLAEKYGLVPDSHGTPSWYKVVVMEHVNVDNLEPFIEDLKQEKQL